MNFNSNINFKNAALILSAAAVLICGGCGKTDGGDVSTAASDSQPQNVTAAQLLDRAADSGLAPQLDFRADYGSTDFDEACEKLYGSPLGDFTDGGIMFVSSGESADEISVLSGSCTEIMQARRDRRAGDFEGYAPDEEQKIKDAEIFEYGGFTVLVIAENADEIKAAVSGD